MPLDPIEALTGNPAFVQLAAELADTREQRVRELVKRTLPADKRDSLIGEIRALDTVLDHEYFRRLRT